MFQMIKQNKTKYGNTRIHAIPIIHRINFIVL